MLRAGACNTRRAAYRNGRKPHSRCTAYTGDSISLMDDTETSSNHEETAGNLGGVIASTADLDAFEQRLRTRLDVFAAQMTGRLDHIDTIMHEMAQQITAMHDTVAEHRPLLDAWTGKGIRGMLSATRRRDSTHD